MTNVGISLAFSSKSKIKKTNYIDISITDLHQNIFLPFYPDEEL